MAYFMTQIYIIDLSLPDTVAFICQSSLNQEYICFDELYLGNFLFDRKIEFVMIVIESEGSHESDTSNSQFILTPSIKIYNKLPILVMY